MNEKKHATKEDWKYLKKLVKDKRISGLISKGEDKNIWLLRTMCMSKGLIERYVQDKRDINVYYGDSTLLFMACYRGHKDIVELLLDNGADIHARTKSGVSALCIACTDRKRDLVELLLDRGADANTITNNGVSVLYTAAANGYRDIVELLIDRGANINTIADNGVSPLLASCYNGHKDVAELLIDKGADIDIKLQGMNLLCVACMQGQRNVVELLIDKGLDVNFTTDNGVNALYTACYNGSAEVVELLLDRGADVDTIVKGKYNVLYMACLQGHEAIVKLLLKRGVKIDPINDGLNPIEVANARGYRTIVKLLKERRNELALERVHKIKIAQEYKVCDVEQLKIELVEACRKGDKNRAKSLIKYAGLLDDEELKEIIDMFIDTDLNDLINIVGDIRMSKILERIDDEDKCNKIIDKIYMKVKLFELKGKARDLALTKVYEDIVNFFREGTNKNKLRKLLAEVDITDIFLVELIDISKDDMLEMLLSRVSVDRISIVFKEISKSKQNIIVDKLYKERNILKHARMDLLEALKNKIESELREAHKAKKKSYEDILLSTGIDMSSICDTDKDVSKDKVEHSEEHDSTQKKVKKKSSLIELILAKDESGIRALKHNKDEVNRVDANGKTALMYVLERGDNEFASKLIEDKRLAVDIYARDNSGKSVLMYAIEKCNMNVINTLINKGVNMQERDNNNKSVLMYALQRGESVSFIIDLLVRETDYDDTDNSGISVLMYASQGGYMRAVKQLVEMIPGVSRENVLNHETKGITALRVAGEKGNKEVAKYLLSKGAVNYGKLRGDKLNKLMTWWGEVDRERARKRNVVIEQVQLNNNNSVQDNLHF